MKSTRMLIALILTVLVAQVLHSVGAVFTMSYYSNPDFFPVWSKIMMPFAGPPPAAFFFWSIGLGLVTWALFIFVYDVIKQGIPGKNPYVKGLCYGALVFLIGGLSGSMAMFLLINLPLGIILYWAAEGLVVNLVNGVIVALLD